LDLLVIAYLLLGGTRNLGVVDQGNGRGELNSTAVQARAPTRTSARLPHCRTSTASSSSEDEFARSGSSTTAKTVLYTDQCDGCARRRRRRPLLLPATRGYLDLDSSRPADEVELAADQLAEGYVVAHE